MTAFTYGIDATGFATTRHTEDGPYQAWVDVFLVTATTQDGRRWQFGSYEFPNAGAAKSLLRRLAMLKVGTPTQDDRWIEIDPIYGSEAWGPEQEYELACFEADAYGEPRPRWF